jgi:DNA-binding MarR family transcriptional regulator
MPILILPIAPPVIPFLRRKPARGFCSMPLWDEDGALSCRFEPFGKLPKTLLYWLPSQLLIRPYMTKSKEIFQRSTYCVEDSVGYLLARARAKLAKSVDVELMPLDITQAQGCIVMMLASGRYATAAELARELYIDSAAMTRMIDRLEKRGLIERLPRGDDRRIINLRLTKGGQELADELPNRFVEVLKQNFAGFSLDEVTMLKTLLRKLLDGGAAVAETADKRGKEKP